MAQQRPSYAITSVDNALRLAELLSREGSVRVKDAAEELGVAKSTAHRLLAMLCFRGFAVKDGEHLYRSGPALGGARRPSGSRGDLHELALPHLEQLQRELNETVHLMVLRRTNVQFVASLECTRSLRVGSRAGAFMCAHRTSGGQVLLAELTETELRGLFPEGPPGAEGDWGRFTQGLRAIRRRGYGLNEGLTERGIMALGVCVRDPSGTAVAAVAVSAPTMRLSRRHVPQAAEVLRRHAGRLEAELARVAAASTTDSTTGLGTGAAADVRPLRAVPVPRPPQLEGALA